MSSNLSGNRLEYLCRGAVLFPNEDEATHHEVPCIPNTRRRRVISSILKNAQGSPMNTFLWVSATLSYVPIQSIGTKDSVAVAHRVIKPIDR